MVTGKKQRMACPACGKDVAATGIWAYLGRGDPAKHNCPHGRPCYKAHGWRVKDQCPECAKRKETA
jgi:hypothetical protein